MTPRAMFTQLTKRPLVMIVLVVVFGVLILGSSIGPLTIWGPGSTGWTDHYYQVWLRGKPDEHKASMINGHIELNQNVFATGWKPSGAALPESEAINVDISEATFDRRESWKPVTEYWYNRLDTYWYEIYLNEGDGWVHVHDENIHQGYGIKQDGGVPVSTPDLITYELVTDPVTYLLGDHTGLIKVKLVGNVFCEMRYLGVTYWNQLYEDILFAEYTAELRSGVGFARIDPSMPDVVEEGADIEFQLKTGYTHGNGWTCTIRGPSGQTVDFNEDGFTGQDGFDDTVSFTVPFGWFVEGGDNQCEIVLFNHLFMSSVSIFFVIDDITAQPGAPIIEYDTDFKPGSTVSVTVSASPNAETGLPIAGFKVYAYYGSPGTMPGFDFPGEYLVMGTNFQATNDMAAFSFTLTNNREGMVTIKVNAIDTAGRASMGEYATFNVNEGGGGPVDYWAWTMEAIVAALVLVGFVLIMLFYGRAFFAQWWFWVLFLCVIAGLAYAVWYYGQGVMYA